MNYLNQNILLTLLFVVIAFVYPAFAQPVTVKLENPVTIQWLKKNLQKQSPRLVEIMVSVISIDPPPLYFDKTMENLKRIEIHIPAWTIENGKMNLKVRLSGE